MSARRRRSATAHSIAQAWRDFEHALTRQGVQFEVAHVPVTGQVPLCFRDPAGNGVELNFSAADD